MAWHTVKEAAPLIGLSVFNVYRLIESRRLAHRRVGVAKGSGKIQISDEAIAAFLRSCEVPADAPATSGGRPQGRPPKVRKVSGTLRPDGKPMRHVIP